MIFNKKKGRITKIKDEKKKSSGKRKKITAKFEDVGSVARRKVKAEGIVRTTGLLNARAILGGNGSIRMVYPNVSRYAHLINLVLVFITF